MVPKAAFKLWFQVSACFSEIPVLSPHSLLKYLGHQLFSTTGGREVGILLLNSVVPGNNNAAMNDIGGNLKRISQDFSKKMIG